MLSNLRLSSHIINIFLSACSAQTCCDRSTLGCGGWSSSGITTKKETTLVVSLSGYQDSNLGPSGPKPDALTGLRYIPLLYCECKGKAKNIICKLF